jgi:hypothetical protein
LLLLLLPSRLLLLLLLLTLGPLPSAVGVPWFPSLALVAVVARADVPRAQGYHARVFCRCRCRFVGPLPRWLQVEKVAPVPTGHGHVGLVGANDHVVDVGVGESRLFLLTGNPVAFSAPAQLGAWRKLAQLLHCHPVAFRLLGLSFRGGLLRNPLNLLRRILGLLLRNPGRPLLRHLG